jgi:hypothetical protein
MRGLTHTPALRTTLPEKINGYEVLLAVPQRDRRGQYPAWTVLCLRADNPEYVVWTAYRTDDGLDPKIDKERWAATSGDYYGESWFGPTYATAAIARFWTRAQASAWRPDDR